MKTLGEALGRSDKLYLGRFGHRVVLGPDGIILSKQTYPVAGARAEVTDFRSGLAGRKHTTELTITLASGEVLTWHETISGNLARGTHNQAVKFAPAVNSAAGTRAPARPRRDVPEP